MGKIGDIPLQLIISTISDPFPFAVKFCYNTRRLQMGFGPVFHLWITIIWMR